jgi:hypothetical protein
MAMTIKLYETMCAYFDGKLTLEEEKSFLEMVDSDPELKKEFEWEEQLIYKTAFKEKPVPVIASDAGLLHVVPAEAPPAREPVRLRPLFYRRRWAIAAVMAGAIATGVAIWYNSKTQYGDEIKWVNWRLYWPRIDTSKQVLPNKPPGINDQIAQQQKKQEKDKVINNSKPYEPDYDNTPVEVSIVMNNYENEDYEAVLENTSKPITVRGNEADKKRIQAYATFYRGLAFLRLNRDSAAVLTFNGLLKQKAPAELVTEIKWNLAKAYYKDGNKQAATAVLQQLLAAADVTFKTDVKKLLGMIKDDKE